ncbi:hypothetical protein M3215_22770 [Bacillus cytotoxicus]|uniref:Uncharacterized protein n=1 Tax=Bacillus cytotoxicus TaxID=580165 RepID=A0ACC6ACA9_9BACI|nr:hypothetical protein [Bacillus cytotoxicus]
MQVLNEERKSRSFRLTDSEMSLIDDLVDIENDRRMTIARENNLVYKPLNRTSLLLYLIQEKKCKYEQLGEM